MRTISQFPRRILLLAAGFPPVLGAVTPPAFSGKNPDLLSARGFTQSEIEVIMSGNFLHFLQNAWS